MKWRLEPTVVEKTGDELWVGVKGQSNSAIAGSPRNIFRYSLESLTCGGRATEWARGLTRLPNPTKLRMPQSFISGVRLRVITSVVERETTQTAS
jgi:hypothetical protein